MNWDNLYDWFISLGEPYGVNPLVFGLIYVGKGQSKRAGISHEKTI